MVNSLQLSSRVVFSLTLQVPDDRLDKFKRRIGEQCKCLMTQADVVERVGAGQAVSVVDYVDDVLAHPVSISWFADLSVTLVQERCISAAWRETKRENGLSEVIPHYERNQKKNLKPPSVLDRIFSLCLRMRP
jgi:hypothetical protein